MTSDLLYKYQRIQALVFKDHLVFLVAMDITGYQVATVEMALKERRVRRESLGYVEIKETLDRKGLIPTTEIGNSVYGGVQMVGTWDL